MATSLSSPAWRPSWLAGRLRSAAARPVEAPPATGPDDRRLTTALLWLLALACAAFWGWAVWAGRLPWAVPQRAPAALVAPAVPALRSPAELARLLGSSDKPLAPSGPEQRFLVWGVIAGASGRGAALLSVDGQAPKPFAIGAEVAPGWVLQSVGLREVRLAPRADAPVSLTLTLPPPEAVSASANPSPGPTPTPSASSSAPAAGVPAGTAPAPAPAPVSAAPVVPASPQPATTSPALAPSAAPAGPPGGLPTFRGAPPPAS